MVEPTPPSPMPMPAPTHVLAPRAGFSGLIAAVGAGRGVIATDRDGLGLATVAMRKGQGLLLSQRIRDVFGIELPNGPRRRSAGRVAFAGTGPDVWLASQEQGAIGFAAALERDLGAAASVSDQSDGYAVLRLAGPMVRNTLAKLVSIDVHPRAFKVGDVASTMAFHMGVMLWRLEDGSDDSPVFEIAVFRSLAGSFWHALAESAAEFGLISEPPA